jgi:hypothetical protein
MPGRNRLTPAQGDHIHNLFTYNDKSVSTWMESSAARSIKAMIRLGYLEIKGSDLHITLDGMIAYERYLTERREAR